MNVGYHEIILLNKGVYPRSMDSKQGALSAEIP